MENCFRKRIFLYLFDGSDERRFFLGFFLLKERLICEIPQGLRGRDDGKVNYK